MSPRTPHNPLPLTADDRGDRLDRVLGRRLDLSRAQVMRLLDRGLVWLNGRPAQRRDKGRTLTDADRVEVAPFERPEDAVPRPQPALPLVEVARGTGWLIVDKPAGMPVHPLSPDEADTVLNALVARHPQVVGVGEAGLRSGVVHRLDVDTTGCLLFALDNPTWHRLRDAFEQRRLRKTYLALVHGRLEGQRDEAMHLHVARHRPARVRVVDPAAAPMPPGTRRCTLTWRSLAANDDASLVEVDLGTGFLHQIRVMLAALGHPILGDAHYAGDREPNRWGVARPMLHAAALALDAPGPEAVHGACDPPADFREAQAAVFG